LLVKDVLSSTKVKSLQYTILRIFV